MSIEYPLAPLAAEGSLSIAITGRNCAGKTSLLHHFLNHAHQTIAQPRRPIPPRRPQHPILARLAASRIATILSRTVHLAFSFLRIVSKELPSNTRHDFLPAPNCQPITVWDVCGELGIHSLRNYAEEVDIVLFLTRLDHSRADRHDKAILAEIVDVFGNDVLDRLIIVLTRGCALPPVNLSYNEYVRGRSDLLASYARLVWRPVVLPSRDRPQSDAEGNGTAESTPEEAPLVEGGAIINTAWTPEDWSNISFLGGERQQLPLRRRTRRGSQEEEMNPTVRSVLAALANDDNTDEGSISAVPENFVDALFDVGVHPDDKRTFADPNTPPIAVTELSESCPTNERSQKILPDGTPWLANLVATIASVATDAPRKAEDRRARKEEENRPPPLKFSTRFRDMLHSLSEDALRIVLVKIALVILVWQIGSALEQAAERKEKAAIKDSSDVLFELSDEEYDVLTKPDPGSGGNAVLRFGDSDNDLDLEESEEEFFGMADPKGKKERKQIEEIFPIPGLSFPFGSKSTPGQDDTAGETPAERFGESKEPEGDERNGNDAPSAEDSENQIGSGDKSDSLAPDKVSTENDPFSKAGKERAKINETK